MCTAEASGLWVSYPAACVVSPFLGDPVPASAQREMWVQSEMPTPRRTEPGGEARACGTQLIISWGPEEAHLVWVVKAVVPSSCVRKAWALATLCGHGRGDGMTQRLQWPHLPYLLAVGVGAGVVGVTEVAGNRVKVS